jgi:hypothetical protein
MTLIKNISPQGDLYVPLLGKEVAAGATVDVPDDVLDSFICQIDNWQAVSYVAPKDTNDSADSSAATE